MHWLNYHHLLYFWTAIRLGNISRAARELRLAQSTISSQLRQLERAAGSKLYERTGRTLRLTDTGRMVFEYAEDIFTTGRELMERLRGGGEGGRLPLSVGVPDFLPKLLVFRLLQPVFSLVEPVQLICREGLLTELLVDLGLHRLDLVLSDSPAGSQVNVRAYNHLLGETSVSWVGTPELVVRHQQPFPASLEKAPVLLPTSNTLLRRAIEQWMDDQDLAPDIVAEVEDSALLKIFASQGLGMAPVADAILEDVQRQYGLQRLGEMAGVSIQFYAISAERKIKHPAVTAMAEFARTRLFQC